MVNLENIQQLSARLDSDEKLIDQLAAELKGRHLKSRRKSGRQAEPRGPPVNSNGAAGKES